MQKAASPPKADAKGKPGAVPLPVSFKQSWNRTVASCNASGISVPFFLRVYYRRYNELPADRKNSSKRRLDWFHLEAFDRLQDPFHQDNVRGWPPAKVQAWRNREIDPAGYYLHFRDPGEKLRPHGAWTAAEHSAFILRLDTFKVNDWMPDASWGLFSRALAGRTGQECREYYHTLLHNGVLFDPAYGPDSAVRSLAESSCLSSSLPL